MTSLPLAVSMYMEDSSIKKENKNNVFITTCILLPTIIIFLGIFFWSIEQKNLSTFWSTECGKDLTTRRFKQATNDETRADAIFQNSRHHWESIKEDVREWVESNWSRWDEEKPKWLNKVMRAKIPLDLIPTAAERGKEKRRRETFAAEGKGKGNQVVPKEEIEEAEA